MNSNFFFYWELRSKSTPFFHHPFLNLSLISRFLYKGTFGAKTQGRKLARKIARASRVAQWHSRTVPIKPPAQVEVK
jgi:hypothetical protein